MNRRRLVLGAVVVVATVCVLLVGFVLGRIDGDSSEGGRPTITVTGSGVVKAVPDVAEVNLGVSATARTARAARRAPGAAR